MNRFLLIALTAGLLSPIAAKAESIWLVLGWAGSYQMALEKIEMKNMSQCKEQGELWMAELEDKKRRMHKGSFQRELRYRCITGK
tara:strand:- start:339 stop:593 length:255 start_codon:yes stop_codon:yes gene_type:complete